MKSTTEVKAIETFFDGCHFRSRLEARWAMVFKSLGLEYHYEPEGFDLNGLRYLPDFYLPSLDFFFEVKGPFTNNMGPEKATALASATGKMVFLFGNIPLIDSRAGYKDIETGQAYFPTCRDDGYLWCRKLCCGKYGIEYHGRSGRIPCECPNRDTEDWEVTYDDSRILTAYLAARHHRFEPGGQR